MSEIQYYSITILLTSTTSCPTSVFGWWFCCVYMVARLTYSSHQAQFAFYHDWERNTENAMSLDWFLSYQYMKYCWHSKCNKYETVSLLIVLQCIYFHCCYGSLMVWWRIQIHVPVIDNTFTASLSFCSIISVIMKYTLYVSLM